MVVLYCFISFIVGAILMLFAMAMAAMAKGREPRNKVRFYVTRDINKEFTLWLGKPHLIEGFWFPTEKAYMIITSNNITDFGLNIDDFENLKWNDEPIEVFLNLEE